jgi:hypothetical protein
MAPTRAAVCAQAGLLRSALLIDGEITCDSIEDQ